MMTTLLTAIALLTPARAETVSTSSREPARYSASITASNRWRWCSSVATGLERSRTFEMRVRKDGERVQTYVRFSKPSDVAGTCLIVIDNPDRADEQLLYSPAPAERTASRGRRERVRSWGAISHMRTSRSRTRTAPSTRWSPKPIRPGSSTPFPATTPATHAYSRRSPRPTTFPSPSCSTTGRDSTKKTLEVLETATENGSIIPTRSVMKNEARGTSTKMNVTSWRLNVPAAEIPDETFTVGFMERNG